MDSALRSDEQKVTVTWRTAAIDEYTHTFTLGELRDAVNAERDAHGYAKHPDIAEDLYLLCESWLADYEPQDGGTLVSFDREIADHTDISLPVLPVFTVTVAGPERHDGEKPYTYVLHAADLPQARALALAHHIAENELDVDRDSDAPSDPDVLVIEGQWDTFPGPPPWPQDLPGRAWNDLRGNEDLLTRAYATAGAR
jgi:hypothetical protein